MATTQPQVSAETYQLDNGLTVQFSHDTRLPVVAVEVRYLVGSGHEGKGLQGFAHLFEHLMFQGSENHPTDYFGPFEPIGGEINGTTNRDRTNYFERVPREYLELALWMESDRMQNMLPALTQKKLDNQRDVVLNERRQRYENEPYGMVWEYLTELMYPPTHPYGHTAMGSPDDLKAATLQDVSSFFSQYYVPRNAVLTIVGDFDSTRARELVQRYFGAIEGGSRAPRLTASIPKLTEIKRAVHEDNVNLPKVYLAWHSPALYAAGDAELDLMASVLTRGKTSRLYQPLVYEKKLAKDVSAYQASQGLSSFFVVEATAAPGVDVEVLRKELVAELERALTKPIAAVELQRAVNGWRKSFFLRMEAVTERAMALSDYFHFTGTPNYVDQDLARYLDATPESVAQIAQATLDTKAYVELVILPRKGATAPEAKDPETTVPAGTPPGATE